MNSENGDFQGVFPPDGQTGVKSEKRDSRASAERMRSDGGGEKILNRLRSGKRTLDDLSNKKLRRVLKFVQSQPPAEDPATMETEFRIYAVILERFGKGEIK